MKLTPVGLKDMHTWAFVWAAWIYEYANWQCIFTAGTQWREKRKLGGTQTYRI